MDSRPAAGPLDPPRARSTLGPVLDLVLLRHGQSTWNAENLFTGWVDVDLTPAGEAEASRRRRAPGEGLDLRILHTSVLTRAIRTAELALAAAGRSWLPVRRHWRLNERHYGDLQGKNKAQTKQEFGDEQLMLWRRSYDTPPPPLSADNPYDVAGDPRYDDVDPADIPRTECLADVVRARAALLGVRHRARPARHRRAGWRRARGRPRQLHPRPAQAPRGHLRRRRSPASRSRPASPTACRSTTTSPCARPATSATPRPAAAAAGGRGPPGRPAHRLTASRDGGRPGHLAAPRPSDRLQD